jgi:PIN domain nuclease of toxin-antitoxin system
MRKTGKKALS